MERSQNQKILRILSIIAIVAGILGLIMGAGIAFISGAATTLNVEGETAATLADAGVTIADVGGAIGMGAVVIIIGAICEIISGALGLRAANDNQKIMPVWIFSIIGVVASVVGLVMAIMDGTLSMENITPVTNLIGSCLMMWISNAIKQEAGK